MYLISNKKVYYNTPLGTAEIIGDNHGIKSVKVVNHKIENSKIIPTCLKDCIKQLDEYFEGKRTTFNLQLNPDGTKFQKKVWIELVNIPFGKTISYLTLAKKINNVKAIRAVGYANGKNPIWIIIPCHRVIGSDGSLTGYAGGIWRKEWLINHENSNKQMVLF